MEYPYGHTSVETCFLFSPYSFYPCARRLTISIHRIIVPNIKIFFTWVYYWRSRAISCALLVKRTTPYIITDVRTFIREHNNNNNNIFAWYLYNTTTLEPFDFRKTASTSAIVGSVITLYTYICHSGRCHRRVGMSSIIFADERIEYSIYSSLSAYIFYISIHIISCARPKSLGTIIFHRHVSVGPARTRDNVFPN